MAAFLIDFFSRRANKYSTREVNISMPYERMRLEQVIIAKGNIIEGIEAKE